MRVIRKGGQTAAAAAILKFQDFTKLLRSQWLDMQPTFKG